MGVSRFSLEFFCLTVPKISAGNPLLLPYFRVPKKFGYKGGEYQDNPSSFFCLTVSKITVGEFFTVALNSSSEKVYGQEGGKEYQNFTSKIFCLIVPKISVGNPLLLPYFRVPKKFG